MRFNGLYFNPDEDGNYTAAHLSIKDGVISFNDREDTWRYKIDTTNPQYYIGTDNSGGNYEKIVYTGAFFQDWTIIGNGGWRQKRVVIQTWNRVQYFIDGCQEVKLCGKGRHKYYDRSSSTESTIIVMDETSATKLSEFFDQVKEQSGIQVWRP